MPSHDLQQRAGASGPTVLLVVWPEYGHVVTPLALAKQLRGHGFHVVFAGARTFEKPMHAMGYEYANLSAERAGGEPTLFDFLPGRSAFESAVEHFITTFRAALAEHRPALILLDSLYSSFGALASEAGIPWGLYETDLPREYDARVPPPHLMLPPSPQSFPAIADEWARRLHLVAELRANALRSPDTGYAWATAHFPGLLTQEIQRRLGTSVSFTYDTLYAPIARVPRMVFCPEAFDFERDRRTGLTWVGPCIDYERSEPDFPWGTLPTGRRIAYCSLGTQSNRHANAVEILQTVVDVFSAREDHFLVLACTPSQRSALRNLSERVLVVEKAPQLALLRKTSLALTHAGFNSIKECAALGVPMVALPLGLDQPRNAALVLHHGLGTALDVNALTVSRLDAAVTAVARSGEVKAACGRMKSRFDSPALRSLALRFVTGLLGGKSQAVRARRKTSTNAEPTAALSHE